MTTKRRRLRRGDVIGWSVEYQLLGDPRQAIGIADMEREMVGFDLQTYLDVALGDRLRPEQGALRVEQQTINGVWGTRIYPPEPTGRTCDVLNVKEIHVLQVTPCPPCPEWGIDSTYYLAGCRLVPYSKREIVCVES